MRTNPLVCPQCKQGFASIDEQNCHCEFCSIDYPIWLGIPDLRFPRPGPENSENSNIRRLSEHFEISSYEELLEIYFSSPTFANLPPEAVARVHAHRTNQLQRGSDFSHMFLSRLQSYYELPVASCALEIGCGSGAGLVSLAKSYHKVIGLDPSLPELLLARKFCDENDAENVQLIQAYAQYLPYQDAQFNYVTAQNVLEHVFEVDKVTLEVSRVLEIGGCFTADSRNRYDLFFPEPHVKVRWVGMLPRRWANGYVRWRTGLEEYETHTRLLSYGDLRRALTQAFGDSWRIVLPRVSAYGLPGRADDLLIRMEKQALLESLVLRIFPSHLALAQKRSPGTGERNES